MRITESVWILEHCSKIYLIIVIGIEMWYEDNSHNIYRNNYVN